MYLARRNGMPSLAHLRPDRFEALAREQAFGVLRVRTDGERTLLARAARLIDQALQHYHDTSAAFDTALSWMNAEPEFDFVSLHRGAASAADCVAATARCWEFAEELGRIGMLDRALLPDARDVGEVREMAAAIDHVDARLLGRRRPQVLNAQRIQVRLESEQAELGSTHLRWTVLARTVAALHHALDNPVR